MKLLATLLLLLAARSLYAQPDSEKAMMSLVTQHINTRLSQDSTSLFVLVDKPVFYHMDNACFSTDSVESWYQDSSEGSIKYNAAPHFTVDDSIYMSGQLSKYVKRSTFPFNINALPNTRKVSSKKIEKIFKIHESGAWDIAHKVLKTECYHEISIPIFNQDRTKAVFYTSSHCGWLNGSGQLVIYFLENGKWVHKWLLVGWIS